MGVKSQQPCRDHKGRRQCHFCGDFIDPKDWCYGCEKGKPCSAHRSIVKRSDARFCGPDCRRMYYKP